MQRSVLFLLLFTVPAWAATTPKEGLYHLEGFSPVNPNAKYTGGISLTKKGDVYFLGWKIGEQQSQMGVGILQGDILSVGYLDRSGQDLGVVSFKVLSPTKLVGRWASLGATETGQETLTWKSAGPAKK